MRYFCFIILFYCMVDTYCSNDGPEITIDQGILNGKYVHSRFSSRKFSAFLGIPYAEPPLGDLRFKNPVSHKGWSGIRDATKDSAECIQRNPYTRDHRIHGEEDCLYLTVYTPQELPYKSDNLLPVMVFLHGGGWVCGAGISGWYGPDFLLEHDVLLVVPNYRLGPLGFISTGDDVAPGNFGLKDQVLALKWIQSNIQKFGGDPNKVTIFGESAGGASAHFHMLSPLSKGLLHRAISQSGTSLCSWAVSQEGVTQKNTKKLAELFNCPTSSSQELVDCLRTKDAISFIEKDKDFYEWDYDPMIAFKPTVEHNHPDAFLTEYPVEILKSGRSANIPWMTGITSSEGALRAAGIFGNPHLVKEFDELFDRVLPVSLFYDESAPDPHYVTQRIKQFYFGDGPIDNSSLHNLVDLYTDGWFLAAADRGVRLQAAFSQEPVFLYYFSYRATASFSEIFGDPRQDYGVSHADDLQYLFPVRDVLFPDKKFTSSEIRMAQIFTKLWTDFARTGNPTPEASELIPVTWAPVQTADLEYFHIENDSSIHMSQGLLSERAHFWTFLPVSKEQSEMINQIGRDEL